MTHIDQPDPTEQSTEITHGPNIEEFLSQLEHAGSITPEVGAKLRANHRYFEENRERIEQRYKGRWVAAVDETILSARTLERLQKRLSRIEGGDMAYAEEIQNE